MKKMVIFNVGGALSAYLKAGNYDIMIDLGKSKDFNPVTDFLVPLYEQLPIERSENGDKFPISQLIISHPHIDHISAICDFDEHFSPEYVTCPNDKPNDDPDEQLDFSEFDEGSDEVQCLRDMFEHRELPLREIIVSNGTDSQKLFYLKPGVVKRDEELSSGDECYQNNVSLMCLFSINGHRVLFPGDIMKNGMKRALDENPEIVNELHRHHLCFLVAPHHGLRSSFSADLFSTIKDNKVRCLNIISEKPNNPDEHREVDSRYSQSDYCMGDNDLEPTNGYESCFQRKTSQGHICVDFSNGSRPEVKIIQDNDELIEWFMP